METIIERQGINIGVRTIGDDGAIKRRVIEPGSLVSGTWTPTDISGESAEIKTLAAELWTPATMARVEAEYRASQYTSPPDAEIINAALMQEGSVFRALALVLFEEINKLRVASVPSQPAYTMVQYRAALKAKMRS